MNGSTVAASELTVNKASHVQPQMLFNTGLADLVLSKLLKRRKEQTFRFSCSPLDSQLLVAHLLHGEHHLLLHALSQFEVELVSVFRHRTVQRRTSVFTHTSLLQCQVLPYYDDYITCFI